jgi:hypothetical protein
VATGFLKMLQSVAINHRAILFSKEVEKTRLGGKAVEGYRSPRRFAFASATLFAPALWRFDPGKAACAGVRMKRCVFLEML